MMKKEVLPIVWIAVLLLLIVELCYTIYSYIDYNDRKRSGNERWRQVEERIKKLEEEYGRICKDCC